MGIVPFRAIRRNFKMAFDRLGYIGLGDCPEGLEPPTGARNRRKATVKVRRIDP